MSNKLSKKNQHNAVHSTLMNEKQKDQSLPFIRIAKSCIKTCFPALGLFIIQWLTFLFAGFVESYSLFDKYGKEFDEHMSEITFSNLTSIKYMGVAAILMLMFAFVFGKREVPDFFTKIKFSKTINKNSSKYIGLSTISAILLAFSVYFFISVLGKSTSDINVVALIFTIIINCLVLPITYNIVFRNIIINMFKDIGLKFWLANIIQAFLFAIIQIDITRMLPALPLGLLLGYLLKKTDNLYVVICIHALYNAVLIVLSNINIFNLDKGLNIGIGAAALILAIIIQIISNKKHDCVTV